MICGHFIQKILLMLYFLTSKKLDRPGFYDIITKVKVFYLTAFLTEGDVFVKQSA